MRLKCRFSPLPFPGFGNESGTGGNGWERVDRKAKENPPIQWLTKTTPQTRPMRRVFLFLVLIELARPRLSFQPTPLACMSRADAGPARPPGAR